jgi:predicted double-glycine peptidase
MQANLGGEAYSLPTRSQHALRFQSTLQQQYDFSCGSAAIASLLSFHYGTPTTEQAAFDAMVRVGDVDKIRREGFSLLDMKRYLATLGFQADGFELPLEKLTEARIPAIVLINDRGYQHFVIVKGLRNGRVLVGDPSLGSRLIPRQQFEAMWKTRLLFVIHNRQDLADFDTAADWKAAPLSPLAQGISREGLGAVTIPRVGVNEN